MMQQPVSPHLQSQILRIHAQLQQGKSEAALMALQRLLPKAGHIADVHVLMMHALTKLNRMDQAEYAGERALELSPDDISILHDVGLTYAVAGKNDKADALMRRAVEIEPTFAPARLHLANRALGTLDPKQAAEHCEAALAREPNAMIFVTYVGALLAQSRVEDAARVARQAFELFPDQYLLASACAQTLNARQDAHPAQTLDAHLAYGRLIRQIVDQWGPQLAHDGAGLGPWLRAGQGPRPDPEMPLRIGFVTADARTHSCAFFLLPLLERLRERAQAASEPGDGAGPITTVLYATNRLRDAMTQRLEAAADLSRDASGIRDGQLAKRIREDHIHILIDLMGHTLGDSLALFAIRPAPVQATYLGYPNTTGLNTIDWRIVDSRTDPAGDGPWGTPNFDERCVEKLHRLDPCFLCYRPPTTDKSPELTGTEPLIPEPSWTTPLSRDPAAPPVFASFNASTKLSLGCLERWAHVLQAVPDSRLFLKASGYTDPGARQRVLDTLASFGVHASRIEFSPWTKGIREHLSTYARVDIALDTMPYNGTTTTCEATWMGVPTLTIAGPTHASRVGLSLLSAVGVPELCAPESAWTNQAEYVERCVSLARDHARLANYRATLRERMRASPLCDEAAFASRFAGAMRTMWRQYCAAW